MWVCTFAPIYALYLRVESTGSSILEDVDDHPSLRRHNAQFRDRTRGDYCNCQCCPGEP